MKNNAKCIAQTTINLSKLKTANANNIGPERCRVKKLVNADIVANPCPNIVKNSYKTTCRPVPVKICSVIDMQRILQPEICKCPEKSQRTLGKLVSGFVKNLFKTGIAAGLVYWTIAEGFWGDSEESEDLYQRIVKTVAPAFEEAVIETKEIHPPHIENMKYNLLDAYNRTVLRIVGLIAAVPIIIDEKMYHTLSSCQRDEKSVK